MTLTGRLLAFVLTALGAVLLGFSVTLYLLAWSYLERQTTERLEAALDTLAAAAEVRPDGVEWEPHERDLALGQHAGPDEVRWLVRDDRGRVIDRSRNLAGHDFPASSFPDEEASASWPCRDLRLDQREVHAGRAGGVSPPRGAPMPPGTPSPRGVDAPRSPDPASPNPAHKELVYPFITITVGLSLDPQQDALRRLALALAGVGCALWLLAALLGRWICRRALLAVTGMAAAARSMSAEALDQRLPVPPTNDELQDLGQAFNGLLTRLQESFERQRRFSGDASHQLRTPLTAMLGQVEVALRRDRSAEEYRRVLGLVQSQALNLRRIVEMLLFLVRADAEARLGESEAVDLAGWLREHLQSWSTHARAADLRLDVAIDGPAWVMASAPLLGQLLDNLLDNACKYSEPGSAITVRLTAGEEVCLSVADAGPGVAPEDLAHLFEPFYRSAQARRRGLAGVGLGLAVARRIAGAFGGSLTVQSNPGQGAVFTLRLPRANHGAA